MLIHKSWCPTGADKLAAGNSNNFWFLFLILKKLQVQYDVWAQRYQEMKGRVYIEYSSDSLKLLQQASARESSQILPGESLQLCNSEGGAKSLEKLIFRCCFYVFTIFYWCDCCWLFAPPKIVSSFHSVFWGLESPTWEVAKEDMKRHWTCCWHCWRIAVFIHFIPRTWWWFAFYRVKMRLTFKRCMKLSLKIRDLPNRYSSVFQRTNCWCMHSVYRKKPMAKQPGFGVWSLNLWSLQLSHHPSIFCVCPIVQP